VTQGWILGGEDDGNGVCGGECVHGVFFARFGAISSTNTFFNECTSHTRNERQRDVVGCNGEGCAYEEGVGLDCVMEFGIKERGRDCEEERGEELGDDRMHRRVVTVMKAQCQ